MKDFFKFSLINSMYQAHTFTCRPKKAQLEEKKINFN